MKILVACINCKKDFLAWPYKLKNGGGRFCSKSCATSHKLLKHGKRFTKEYKTWCRIRYKCHNPNDRLYKQYGAKGIEVCERWRNSFDAFLEDMGDAPSLSHSIDRYPNNKGNYEPSNCRWATFIQQQRNRTDNIIVTHNGANITLPDLAEKYCVPYRLLLQRFKKGWTLEKALT